jgi:hypothetical protein
MNSDPQHCLKATVLTVPVFIDVNPGSLDPVDFAVILLLIQWHIALWRRRNAKVAQLLRELPELRKMDHRLLAVRAKKQDDKSCNVVRPWHIAAVTVRNAIGLCPGVVDPKLFLIRMQIPIFSKFRIQIRQKKIWILADPDPQHCFARYDSVGELKAES